MKRPESWTEIKRFDGIEVRYFAWVREGDEWTWRRLTAAEVEGLSGLGALKVIDGNREG